MPALSFRRIAEMAGGRVACGGDRISDSVVIDSREAKPGATFFALRGERLDAHEFLDPALELCAGAVVERLPQSPRPDRSLVLVENTTRALQELARGIRREFPFLLIGITGSAGKTTTKEMIASLIETEKTTWKSWENFNNHIGFPLCLVNTPEETEVVVSEMGMSAKGEIAFLANLAQPDLGVYTNIRPVHLEFFDSIEGIAAAKRELLENLKPGGALVINADDERVVGISEGFSGRKITYGVENQADYRAVDVRMRGLLGSEFWLVAEGSSRQIELSLPGRHNLENLLAAFATARTVGVSWNGIERGLGDLRPSAHRGVIVEARGATLYDDTYNSNPYALGRAMELLASADWGGRRIAVVGDMLELGRDELRFHEDAGRAIPTTLDAVIAVGERSRSILKGAKASGYSPDLLHHFADAEEAGAFLEGFILPGDLVLLKASRGIGLDRIVRRLEKER